jgi:hypothetical protein
MSDHISLVVGAFGEIEPLRLPGVGLPIQRHVLQHVECLRQRVILDRQLAIVVDSRYRLAVLSL